MRFQANLECEATLTFGGRRLVYCSDTTRVHFSKLPAESGDISLIVVSFGGDSVSYGEFVHVCTMYVGVCTGGPPKSTVSKRIFPWWRLTPMEISLFSGGAGDHALVHPGEHLER